MGLRTIGIWALLPFFLIALGIFFTLDLEGIEKERVQLEGEGQASVNATTAESDADL